MATPSSQKLSEDSTFRRRGVSYFALFRPLQDVQSRCILFAGVVLAIAAGAPLPIIGVIFARIIDAFPPTEDEIVERVYQLLAVGNSLPVLAQINANTLNSLCLLRCHLGMVLLLGHNRGSHL